MKFEEVLPELRKGKNIRRKYMLDCIRAKLFTSGKYTINLESTDLLADDWEAVTEPFRCRLRHTKQEIEQKFGVLADVAGIPAEIPPNTIMSINIEECVRLEDI